ncbi:MAG: S41 family peptidase [Chloroflexota bacterium]
MSWPSTPDAAPPGAPPPPSGWPDPSAAPTPLAPPVVEPARAPAPSRTSVVVALFLVAVLAGSALFAAGFTLGLQQSLTPGTGESEQELFAPFWEAYRKVTSEYVGAYEPKALVEGAIQGMFGALGDPYSSYMTSDEYKRSLEGIEGSFEGIGATMSSHGADGTACTTLGEGCDLVVEGVIPGSPAEKGGLLAGDLLVAVDGREVAGSTLDDVVDWVRGPSGSQVTLSLLRDGSALDLALTREVIEQSAVQASTLADGRVGLIGVSGFSSGAAADLRAALETQLAAGAQGFVLDLRDDPGGYVDAALAIASEFVGSGPIYWDEYADGTLVEHDAQAGGVATDPSIPVVVLVNGGTASASEIVSGALHDTGRATLVGETTFGKGTVQQWHLLSGDAGGFRLSVAKWLTPDKTWIHGVGITPDVVVEPGQAGADDPQVAKALDIVLGTLDGSSPAPSPAVAATAPAAGSPSPRPSAQTPSPAASPSPS